MGVSKGKTVLLLKPRGFCAGVVRAIDIVRIALETFGPPIYVRKEIVHNRFVVEELQAKGAVFVDEVDLRPGQIDDRRNSKTRRRLKLANHHDFGPLQYLKLSLFC